MSQDKAQSLDQDSPESLSCDGKIIFYKTGTNFKSFHLICARAVILREERRKRRDEKKGKGEESNSHAGFSETFSKFPRQREHNSTCVVFSTYYYYGP